MAVIPQFCFKQFLQNPRSEIFQNGTAQTGKYKQKENIGNAAKTYETKYSAKTIYRTIWTNKETSIDKMTVVIIRTHY